MEHQRNNRSNSYNLRNYFAISAFNAESSHKIKVKINQKTVFEKEFTKNKEYQIKIEEYFDYEEPGSNTIEITWDGEQECADKFIKIYKVIVNEQNIAPHSVIITPIPNDYIKSLLSTTEGTIFYKKQLFNPGIRHGWYGMYKFKFLLDADEIKNNNEELMISSTGIKLSQAYTDLSKIKYHRKANKK